MDYLVTQTLDLRGEICPLTFVRTKLALEQLPLGAVLAVTVDHPPASEQVPRSLRHEGHLVISVEKKDNCWHIIVRKETIHPLEEKSS